MFKIRPSIRQKITLGYYAIVVIIVGLSIFTFLELRVVEKKIMFGAAISDFFDTTLEIRRFEKNYFLYAKEIDYQENIRKTGKEIITMSEDISRMERKNLQLLLARYQKILIISIITLSTLAIVIGQILSRMVVRPLQSLEEGMGGIAEGKFERVAIDSKDREIVSLTEAFHQK